MAEDHLTIKFKNEPRELFMSFKRLNQCVRVVQNGESFVGVITDPDDAEMILQILLAEKGQSPVDVEIDEEDLSPQDFNLVISWATEHLISFFVNKFQEAQGRAEQLQPIRDQLQKSQLTGSQA